MRTWVKATIGGIALIAVAFAALAGTGAYFVLRSMDKKTGSEPEAVRAIDAVKARFGSRPPLIEIAEPRTAEVRIHRQQQQVKFKGEARIHLDAAIRARQRSP
jgi:hypothetical protein